jgi:hypothetical protein
MPDLLLTYASFNAAASLLSENAAAPTAGGSAGHCR